MRTLIASLFFLSSLFFPVLVLAHGTETALKATVGSYEARLEYDAPGNPLADEATAFNFDLSNAGTEEDAAYDRVFVTVTKTDGPIIFLANVSAIDVSGVKTSRARIFLPKEGSYEFSLEYYMGEKKLATHTFSLTADPAYGGMTPSAAHSPLLWILGIVLGLGLGFFIGKTR